MSAILAICFAAVMNFNAPAFSAPPPWIEAAVKTELKRKKPRKRVKKRRRFRRPPIELYPPLPEEREPGLLAPGELPLPAPYTRATRPDFPRACISDLDCSIGGSCNPFTGQCQ